MGAMDQVSPDIYVGSVWALSSPRDLYNANITHIISVLRGEVKDMTTISDPKNNIPAGFFRQLHIEIDDDDEEDIMRFFPRTNAFIQSAVDKKDGEKTLIHCVAGVSRSVTIACAYLLWRQSVEHPGIFEDASESLTTEQTDEHGHVYEPAETAAKRYVEDVIEEVRKYRTVAGPNPSFRQQLAIYVRCGCPNSSEQLASKKLYRQWVLQKQAEGIPLSGKPPKNIQYLSENGGILRLKSNETGAQAGLCEEDDDDDDDAQDEPRHITADEVIKKRMEERKKAAENRADNRPSLAELSSKVNIQSSGGGQTDNSDSRNGTTKKPLSSQLRCKKCRAGLASSNGLIAHAPESVSASNTNNINKRVPFRPTTNGAPRNGMPYRSSIPPQCMHYYMEPAAWMRPELEKGDHEGKFSCPNPKCNAKVGTYSWHGDTCSCGKWVTPAIGLLRTRVDEVPIRQAL